MPDPMRSDQRWAAAARAGCAAGAIEGADGVLVRTGTAMLVRFGPVLVRAWAPARAGTAFREAAVARALAAAGVPAVRLVETIDQPIVEADAVMTVWHWLDLVTGDVSPTELGMLAGRLRRATAGRHDLAPFDPLGMVRQLLVTTPAAGGDATDLADLHRMVDDVEPAWNEVVRDDPAGTGVVHGDLHRLNVLRTADGPLLADLEMAGAGPPSYDTAPMAVAVRRYGADPADLDAFLTAAGHDPRRWPGFEVCCRVYELWVTAWALVGRAGAPDVEREARVRMASLRGVGNERWHLR